ncbi:MAG: YbhB/YbcL family Raf kinase inhibitor-like protein [FCB group bacterium]|jgi:Raf kinase inhibitor-like YbhB/YbcL family protein
MKKLSYIFLIIIFAILISSSLNIPPKGTKIMDIIIKSSAFENNGFIPKQYTCDGKNISPKINWSNLPTATKSIALICDDPDAPMGTWVHWVIYNIPPDVKELPENVPPLAILPNKAIQGKNDFKKIGYGGPCPPSGVHRYFFKIYALDLMLKNDPGLTKDQLLKAIEGHIISKGELIGKFKR